MIVVIDDERTLHERTQKNEWDYLVPARGDSVHLRNIYEAVGFFEMMRPGPDLVLFLDHDLGPGGDSREFTRWLKNNHEKFPGKDFWTVFVHSMNPPGADNLVSDLEDIEVSAKRIPIPEEMWVDPTGPMV